MVFNLEKFSGRKRIRDRGIKWIEHYREKSARLKKRFDRDIGPGAYYRWEGHDYTSDGDYFIVVGPAVTKEGRKRFFSGIKRLPPVKDKWKKHYAPSGEYFSNISSALSHASQKWGITYPRGQPQYGEAILSVVNIPRHVKGSEEAVIKTADNKVLRKINTEIYNLLRNQYFDKIPLGPIFGICKKYNVIPLQEDGTEWSGFLLGGAECGSEKAKNQRAMLPLAEKLPTGELSHLNSSLVVEWCVMPSGKYEINSYVS